MNLITDAAAAFAPALAKNNGGLTGPCADLLLTDKGASFTFRLLTTRAQSGSLHGAGAGLRYNSNRTVILQEGKLSDLSQTLPLTRLSLRRTNTSPQTAWRGSAQHALGSPERRHLCL